MLSKRDFYKVLGVAPTATQDEIRKAYRMLSKKYHPDLNPDLKIYSDEKMKELVEAYNVLNDPDARKEYDKQPQFQVRKSRSGKNLPPQMGGSYTKKPKIENAS
jgi:DnaJ-class molecular chaperone